MKLAPRAGDVIEAVKGIEAAPAKAAKPSKSAATKKSGKSESKPQPKKVSRREERLQGTPRITGP